MSPSWKTSVAKTAIRTRTPAANPNPAFTPINASTRWSRLAYATVSRVASRMLGCSWCSSRRSENARPTRKSSHAESRNEAELPRKAASRPNSVTTRPPRAAPTASIVPHAEPTRPFAAARSSGSTTLGIAAADAGSKQAVNTLIEASSTKTIHTVPLDSTSSRGRHRTARARSAAIISRRRSTRSAKAPPTGDNRKNASSGTVIVSATNTAEPVSRCTSPNRATTMNQSPPKEISWAA